MSLSLTNVRELDRLVLLELDDPSLARACQANRWLQQICSDDLFWKERFQRRFGDQVKSPEDTYRQMYIRFSQLSPTQRQLAESAARGRLDEMLYLIGIGVPVNPLMILHTAVVSGQFDVFKWILTEWANALIISSHLLVLAARYNRLDMMKWLNQHYPGMIDNAVVQTAYENGSPAMLDWLLQLGYIPRYQYMFDVFRGNNIQAIDWMANHGIRPSVRDATRAAQEGKVTILEHLYQNYGLLPRLYPQDINRIAYGGHLDTLKWLAAHGFGYPDSYVAEDLRRRILDAASRESYQDILGWMAQLGLY